MLMGGPMMGIAIYDENYPLIKNNNALLCFGEEETKAIPESACIRCGRCVRACPFSLMPAAIDKAYRAKDVEEMNGHFLMFNKMLDTLEEELTSELIKQFHYELKSGVFEDRANGYAIGDYKKRPNMIGMYQTTRPKNVSTEIQKLLDWYHSQPHVDVAVLAELHARYESIHPFQDGNGRIGRIILFRECLKHRMTPIVIEDANRNQYIDALKEYREEETLSKMIALFEREQAFYFERCQYFV